MSTEWGIHYLTMEELAEEIAPKLSLLTKRCDDRLKEILECENPDKKRFLYSRLRLEILTRDDMLSRLRTINEQLDTLNLIQ